MVLCNEKLKPEMFKTADDIQAFTDTLIHIAEKCIPKSSTHSKRNRPWFNNDVKNLISSCGHGTKAVIQNHKSINE